MSNILKVNQLAKRYKSGQKELTVLEDVSFEVPEGSTFAIVGPSGSGKTTLLGLCAGLDDADSGEVILQGTSLQGLSEDERAGLRNREIGFIFQNFQLIPTLTAEENVSVPMELRGAADAQQRSIELLEQVGLGDRRDHYPSQLSGGEQQRVALARAFSTRPALLFADEPTGNLDEETGDRVIQLLFELNKASGTTLIIVTHDLELAGRCQRILKLKGGRILEQIQTEG